MKTCHLVLAGNWSAKEMSNLLHELDKIYSIFLVAAAVEERLSLKSETTDTEQKIVINGEITNLMDILFKANSTPDEIPEDVSKSRELAPYKKLEIKRIEQDGKKGFLEIFGYDKPIKALKFVLGGFKKIVFFQQQKEIMDEKARQSKIDTINKLISTLDNIGMSKEKQKDLALILFDEAGLIPKLMKDQRLKFEDQ